MCEHASMHPSIYPIWLKILCISALTTLVLLPGGDIIAGDSKGGVRGFSQESDELFSRPQKGGFPVQARAHGTMKIVRPKDPSRPLLQQVIASQVSPPPPIN